jgi:hypothetical protein|tara:strand:+ start:5496 stop:6464 length:969 start_codon:yes stop_codon:yes gene_type:complete
MNDPFRSAANTLNRAAPPGERLAYVNPQEEAGLRAAGGQGKPAAGGIPSYKKGDVEAPPARDYGKEMSDTLESQISLAPDLYASEEKYRPQYANLERRIQLEQLGIDPEMGLLEAFEDYIAPSLVRQERAGVQGDIDMLRELGPQLVQAQRAADPLAESLRQSVMTTALEDMQAGGGMTAQETRDTDQQALAMASQRGLVGQNVSDYDRMRAKLVGDRGAKAQRMQNASAAFGMGASDPLLALTGRRMNTGANVANQFGTAGFGLDSSPAIFNPESAYAGALATQNWQGDMDARTATASNKSAMTGALLGGAGTAFGGWLSK